MFTFSLFSYMPITFFIVLLCHLVKLYLISLEQGDKKPGDIISVVVCLKENMSIINDYHSYVSQFVLLTFKFL